MATQQVSNERKKELRQMDPLQRNLFKAMAFTGTYKKQLLYAAGAAVVVGLVFAGILTSFKRSENIASDRSPGQWFSTTTFRMILKRHMRQ